MSEDKKKHLFPSGKRDDESYTILVKWWQELENDRGSRALLRRASSSTEVVFSPAYHRLLNQLQQKNYTVYREALAVAAGLAAHVKDVALDRNLAQQMAASTDGDKAKVSGLRFRRLLAVEQREELYPLMIRLIRLLDGRVNLMSLANAVYWWNEKVRKDWAYAYYETAPAEK